MTGAERIPETGAAIVVANHENSLVDSLALLRALPRQASPLAKAPLFHGLLGAFLRAAGAVPVFRPQDEEENQGRTARANVKVFRECRERLRAGGALVVFPEGISHPQPKLFPLRTGAARIALDLGAPVAIVPVGLAYEPPGPRRGTILVRVGEPFLVDGSQVAPAERRGAIASTTRRIEAALEALLAEAECRGDLALLRTLATVLAQERGAPPPADLDEEHRRVQRAARALEALRATDPKAMDALRVEAVGFQRVLDLARVPLDLLDRPYTAGRIASFLARSVPVFLVGAPFAALAAVLTWPARTVGDVIFLRGGRAEEDVWAVSRLLGLAFVFTVFTLATAAALWLLAGPWVALGALAGLPALLALHGVWRDWRYDARTRVHAFLLLAGGRLRDDLQERRRALYVHLESASERLRAAGVDLDAPSTA